MERSHSKKILIGISGSIAAYKVADLVSLLKDNQIEVRCILTKSAGKFVSPLVLETLSGHPVYADLFGKEILGTEHIRLARWADLFVLAPATANLIAKLSLGLADDLVSTIALATKAPLLIAPAMNTVMWDKEITQAHVKALVSRGCHFIMPATGVLACGELGIGKFAKSKAISRKILELLTPPQTPLLNQKILITAGPTVSFLDPVRYLTNPSTGKMGAALAQEALKKGAEIFYVLGIDKGVEKPRPPLGTEKKFHLFEVRTASEMLKKSLSLLPQVSGVISAAAVLDYEVEKTSEHKLKRSLPSSSLNSLLKLTAAPDVLMTLKAQSQKNQWFFGFAAETEYLEKNAVLKFKNKNLDFLFANLVSKNQKTGFGTNTNAGLFLKKKKAPLRLDLDSKENLAKKLLTLIETEIS